MEYSSPSSVFRLQCRFCFFTINIFIYRNTISVAYENLVETASVNISAGIFFYQVVYLDMWRPYTDFVLQTIS